MVVLLGKIMINRCMCRAVSLLALMLGFAGCASRGNEVLKEQDTTTVNLTIIDGQTTRDEVQRIYGVPAQTTFLSEKNEVWTYRWARATAQGQNFIPVVGAFVRGYDVRKKELVIVFNDRNVVARHSMIDYNDAVKTGLLDNGPASALTGGGSVSTSSGVPAPAASPPPAAAPASSSVPRTVTQPAPAPGVDSPGGPASVVPTSGQGRSRL